MPILDKYNTFGEGTDISGFTAAAGIEAIGDSYRAGADDANVMGGGHKRIHLEIETAVTSAGAATVNFLIQDSNDGSTWVTLLDSGAIGKATLVAGYKVFNGVSLENAREYIRVAGDVGTADLTAGVVNAWIGID